MKKSITLILLALLAAINIVAQTTVNAKYQEIGGVHYNAYITDKKQIYYATSINSESSSGNIIDKKNYTINFEYPASSLSFEAQTEYNKTTQIRIKYNSSQRWWTTSNISAQTRTGKWYTGYTYYDNYTTYNSLQNIPDTACRSIEFEKNTYYLESFNVDIKNVKIKIAPHIYLSSIANGSEQTLGEIEINKSASLNVKFKSFLTAGPLTVTSSNSFFTINGATSYTIANAANSFCSLDDTSKDFKITYQPTSAGTHTATITISDGTNSVTFTVKGSARKKTNSINWNGLNTQMAVGETVSLNNVTATSNSQINFTSNKTDVIKVENGNLFALAAGKATITATATETNDYQSATSTIEIEATQKTIQAIVWDQNFYLLKLGDEDITLNASAIDKETGTANGRTITYSVADESIVTITNGVLHIVGNKGQTTITATQAGDDEYASVSVSKIVNVREVSTGCDDYLAVNAPDKVEKGNDGILDPEGGWNWDAFEVTHTLRTIGDKLNFVTNCTSTATDRKIIVKDQNGTELYNSNNFGTVSNLQLSRDVTSITISVKSNLTRSISNIYVTPAIYVETDKTSVNFGENEIAIPITETVNINWANQPDAIYATIENDANGVFAITENNAFGGSCGDYGKTPVKVQFLGKTEGDYTADLVIYMGIDNPIEKHRIPLSAKAVYRETEFITAGDWNVNENWSAGIPTGMGKNATIKAAVTIPNGHTALANNITIAQGGSISVAPQGKLKVNNIIGSNGTNLTLQANEQGSAILLFNNPADNKVNATVELYSLASSDGLRNGEAGNFKDPKWQYLGVVAESVAYSDLNEAANWLFRWDETQNATSCWAEELNSTSTLSAWTGYCLAQEKATTYTYSGALVNGNHTYSLTYTKSDNSSDDLGNNLITNSYTAPIDITTLSDANFTNAEANIYIYNTGSYLEWKEQTSVEGFNPGQVMVIPVNTVAALAADYPQTIASGQAFFVKATADGASFAVDYTKNVFEAMRTNNMKRARLSDKSDKSDKSDNFLNTLKLQITSSTSNDRLYLLEHEGATANFDNGYDAMKIFDNPNGPQIYASTKFGAASISTSESFDGQTIGFVANDENELYTMSFDITHLISYAELYLYDTETEIYTDILNGENYQFYGSKTPNNGRFSITSYNPNKTPEENTTTDIESTTTIEDILSSNKPIYLYSITGQLISKLNSLSTLNSQLSTLAEGIYIVKCGEKVIKIKF